MNPAAGAVPKPAASTPIAFELLSPGELAMGPADPGWVWHGYLAAGDVTMLTGPWKCGKTTLVSVLTARMGAGGPLAGRAVKAGRVVVVSEEDRQLWAGRCRQLGIGGHARFMCRPFRGRQPTAGEWRALTEHLAGLRDADGLDLVVIDPLASFLPGPSESDPAALADLFGPLRRLAATGVSVLVLHHPRRGVSAAGQSARGGRPVGSFVDIAVELGWVAGPYSEDRRRKLVAFSRHPDTPPRLVIGLGADGTDYAAVAEAGAAGPDEGWPILLRVLMDAGHPLTRPQVLAGWPADCRRPDPATVWRWLHRAVADGRVIRDGTGHRRDPFRYGLPTTTGHAAVD